MIIADGHADFAGVCRLSMDDPEYANKIYQGRENEIRKSTRTGVAVAGNIFGKGWAGSAQNAAFGRDREYRIRPTASPKKVVVGGGSGGMEYAITAKQIGQEVMLFEKSNYLGGAMDWAGNYRKVPNMEIIRYRPEYHRGMMDKFKVPYRLGVEAHAPDIPAENPDILVLATGAKWVLPAAQGLSEEQACGFAVTIDPGDVAREALRSTCRAVIFGAAIGVIKLSWHNDRVRTLHHRLSADYHQFKKPKIVEHWKRAVLIAAMSL